MSELSASTVEQLIRDAFADVRLGEGVGLFQAQAIDDYATADIEAAARARDEKEDWTKLSIESLNSAYSSLSFFDQQGMRFHLPAFLIADLHNNFHQDVVFHLTYAEEEALSRFSLLNAAQRAAVCAYLRYHVANSPEPLREFEGPLIAQAISDYWSR